MSRRQCYKLYQVRRCRDLDREFRAVNADLLLVNIPRRIDMACRRDMYTNWSEIRLVQYEC